MVVTCAGCRKTYDDARCTTICPHEPFLTEEEAAPKDLGQSLVGKRVRFRNDLPQPPDGFYVFCANFYGMVGLRGMSGEFAPDLFENMEESK